MKKNFFEKGLLEWFLFGMLIFDFAALRHSQDNGTPIALKLVGILVLDGQITLYTAIGIFIIFLCERKKTKKILPAEE